MAPNASNIRQVQRFAEDLVDRLAGAQGTVAEPDTQLDKDVRDSLMVRLVASLAEEADVALDDIIEPTTLATRHRREAIDNDFAERELAGVAAGSPRAGRMKLRPLGDRLIVRAIEEEETTASGIVLPDTAKEKPQKGKVVAVGDGKVNEDTGKRTPLDVAEGDEVLYSKYGGTEIKVDGEELLVLRESDVLAKVQ